MLELKLDLLQTLSLAAVLYFVGLKLRERIGWLDRLNIPAAVVGGLLFALLVLVGRDRFLSVQLDTAAQPVLSVAFFSTIGMSASLALLARRRASGADLPALCHRLLLRPELPRHRDRRRPSASTRCSASWRGR